MQKDKISRSLNENQKYIKNVLGDTNSIYTFSDIGMVIMALGMVYPTVSKKKGIKRITVAAMIVGQFLF
ncbi:hypothetical protein JK636_16020 [Clostridium sp. YIM B02515]|uniref:Uncharacterized protein n=1 Tax=Clostridium rhizosphaerae TaxID=2803861 RepID=A0ABS1TD23_9CLOT|nr:hypothetical protein [Clostridium rhizosphaerae]MBL4937235.1 hypothetical protein [Clostridium rhizosphaerae]